MNFKNRIFSVGMLLAVCALGMELRAATVTVEVFSNFFRPATTNINVGDTVNWIPRGTGHDTVSDPNQAESWASPFPLRTTFSHTFTQTGSFTYFCTPHADIGMRGTIIVAGAANTPPTVTISSPINGATFTAPATFDILATASDADGTVASVEFFVDGNSIGTDTSAPYAGTASGLAAGTHTLTARATDNAGGATTSSAVTITVNAPANTPPTVAISSPINGATFTAPATFDILATASDADGTVASVEFFVDGNSVGTDTSAPYAGAASGLAAGTHTLTARATDNAGATTTSSAVTITVNSAPAGDIVLSNVARVQSGIRFDVSGIAAGANYRVQISSDLNAWSELTAGTAPGGTFTVTDATPGVSQRYYRVAL